MRWIAFSQKGALEGRGVVSGVGVMAIFQGEYSSLGNLDKAVPHPAESKFSAGLVGMRNPVFCLAVSLVQILGWSLHGSQPPPVFRPPS